MSAPRRSNKSQAARHKASRPSKPIDIWRPAAELPPVEPVQSVSDPTALLRSLGDPPLPGKRVVAGHYLAAVVERAAGLATALAASADLLAAADPGD